MERYVTNGKYVAPLNSSNFIFYTFSCFYNIYIKDVYNCIMYMLCTNVPKTSTEIQTKTGNIDIFEKLSLSTV